MNPDPEDQFSPEDKLKAENELLKLKLELEHGANEADTSSLSPEVENSWLKNIYNFERQYKNARRVKVYDLLGRPAFKKLEELPPEKISEVLKQLLSLMETKGIELDCCCPYDDVLIYRFITEEFFNHETDDISVDGMVHHFIYEEFHPNHDYDLRRDANEFIKTLLERKWNPEFHDHSLSKTVVYKGKEYDNAEISAIILAFQEGRKFQLKKFEIDELTFDVERGEGKLQGLLAYSASIQQEKQFHQGVCILHFTFDFGYWYISGFELPGFSGY